MTKNAVIIRARKYFSHYLQSRWILKTWQSCFAVAAYFCSFGCSAATLETLIRPFAVPVGVSYSANDWASLDKAGDIAWVTKGLRETPRGYAKLGTTRLSKLGSADVFFSGARTMVFEGSISISEGKGRIVEKDQFESVLKTQFSPQTNIKLIRQGCPDDGAISGSAVYEVTLKNKKPIFVLVQVDAGGNSPNSRTLSFDLSLENKSRWSCS